MTPHPRLHKAMQLVADANLDGWLIADFRWSNPFFGYLLGLQSGILTRRSFLWLPRQGAGEPQVLISRTDAHTVSRLGVSISLYGGFEEMCAWLRDALPRDGRVAMEYVPHGALPTVSVVDAGLMELVLSFGV